MSSLLFDQYEEKLRRKGKSPHSIRAFRAAAKPLDEWLTAEGLTAETATMPALEDYFDGLHYAASTKETHLRYIQAAYNYAIKRGTITRNPALDVEVPKPPPAQKKIIPNECLRVIKSRAVRDRDWIFFHLLAYTGMRRSEIRSLKWDDDDPLGTVLRLPEQTIRVVGKGQKDRLVPVHPALGEVLSERGGAPGDFVVPSTGEHGVAMDTIMDMTKRLSPTYTPHDYRRTVATSLRRNRVDRSVIEEIMGWQPSSVMRRFYDNVASAELHQAILKLYADDPI